MKYDEAVAALDRRTNYERSGRLTSPSLERISALLDLMDHPERGYPVIHVTGTNGKTTTAWLIARILCAHGLGAGVYTSPHLESVRERLAFCDDPISEEEFAEMYGHLRTLRLDDGPDEVHKLSLARQELRRQRDARGAVQV